MEKASLFIALLALASSLFNLICFIYKCKDGVKMTIFEKITATPETLADWICRCFCCGNSEDTEARKEEMIEYFNQEAADEEPTET